MSEINNIIQKLAIILCEVHGNCYAPFYEAINNDETTFCHRYGWDYLTEKSEDPDIVDKIFFIEMAKHIISEVELMNVNKLELPAELSGINIIPEYKVEKLAKILSEVHGLCYEPFYESNEDEMGQIYPYSWEELSEENNNPSEVSKVFFREMARQIFIELGK